MTIRKIACILMLTGLSSTAGIAANASSSWAQESTREPGLPLILAKSDSTGTLRQGLPGRRIGGGTRGGSPNERLFIEDYAYLTALVTADNLGTTTAAYPKIMFYVPEMVEAQTVEFILRDYQDELVYETAFQVDAAGGLITIATASVAEMAPLNLNENYQWYFSIIPEVEDRANDVMVHGNIQRVESETWLAQQQVDIARLEQLSVENPIMQARVLYQEANLWHDAAILLDELQQNNPDDMAITAEWDQLIELAGLSAMLNTPEPAIVTESYQEH